MKPNSPPAYVFASKPAKNPPWISSVVRKHAFHDLALFLPVPPGAGRREINATLGPINTHIRPVHARIPVGATPIERLPVVPFLPIACIVAVHAEVEDDTAILHPIAERGGHDALLEGNAMRARIAVRPNREQRSPVRDRIVPRFVEVGMPDTGRNGGSAGGSDGQQIACDARRCRNGQSRQQQ